MAGEQHAQEHEAGPPRWRRVAAATLLTVISLATGIGIGEEVHSANESAEPNVPALVAEQGVTRNDAAFKLRLKEYPAVGFNYFDREDRHLYTCDPNRVDKAATATIRYFEQYKATVTCATIAHEEEQPHVHAELPKVPALIEHAESWRHNMAIGTSNICVDVLTTPPQARIVVTVDGPGYHKSIGSPFGADGSAQISTVISKPGEYSAMLNVYDAEGTQPVAIPARLTVAPPPQDGPVMTPPCPVPNP